MRDVLLLALTAFISVLALKRPLVGILSFVSLSILGLHSLTWGMAHTFPHSQAVGLATIIGFLLSSEPKRFPSGREARLAMALWALFAVSTFFALEPTQAWDKLIFVSKLFVGMFLCAAIVNTPERLHWLVRTIALSLGFHAVKLGLFVLATGFQQKAWGPDETYLAQENAIGIAFAANVPLLMYLFRVERARWLRWTVVAMGALSYPAVVGTFSRGAWLSLAAVSGLLLLRSRRSVLAISLVAVLAIVSFGSLDQLASDRVTARWGDLKNWEEDSSAESRFWNWEFCRRVGLARPFGGGFDFYSVEAYLRYYPEFVQRWPGKVWVCHSVWFELLAEHGVLGLVLGGGLLASCVLTLRRLGREARKQGVQTRAAELAPLLIVSFFGFLTGGTFLDVAYHELLYQLLAMVIIAGTVWRHEKQPMAAGGGRDLLNTARPAG